MKKKGLRNSPDQIIISLPVGVLQRLALKLSLPPRHLASEQLQLRLPRCHPRCRWAEAGAASVGVGRGACPPSQAEKHGAREGGGEVGRGQEVELDPLSLTPSGPGAEEAVAVTIRCDE